MVRVNVHSCLLIIQYHSSAMPVCVMRVCVMRVCEVWSAVGVEDSTISLIDVGLLPHVFHQSHHPPDAGFEAGHVWLHLAQDELPPSRPGLSKEKNIPMISSYVFLFLEAFRLSLQGGHDVIHLLLFHLQSFLQGFLGTLQVFNLLLTVCWDGT